MARVTVADVQRMKAEKKKIAVMTAYYYEMARIVDRAQPEMILVGDSGQEDPEIYGDLVAEFPGRILAIYIRNVSPHPERSAGIRALADRVTTAGSTLLLADDTLRSVAVWKMEGFTADEIAERLDCSRRSVARKLETIRITWNSEPAP